MSWECSHRGGLWSVMDADKTVATINSTKPEAVCRLISHAPQLEAQLEALYRVAALTSEAETWPSLKTELLRTGQLLREARGIK